MSADRRDPADHSSQAWIGESTSRVFELAA